MNVRIPYFVPTAVSVTRKGVGASKCLTLFKSRSAGSTNDGDVEAPDDVEAAVGLSGIALANLATEQTSGTRI